MQKTGKANPEQLRRVASFLLWSLIFAIAYAQSPLYTSNQNQYFLHGLARAGFGFLSRDWLANTLDPTPVFSRLVEYTYRLTSLEALFYVYYALLMGIYLFSLIGIVRISVWEQEPAPLSPPFPGREGGPGGLGLRTLVFLALVIVIHSAGWRFALSRLAGVNWTYLLEDGVADQRMLGPVFQPSTFGVLLLLSIYLFLRRRPYLAVLTAVLAACFHPTYLLAAGVLTGAYLLVTGWEERDIRKPLAMGALALLAVAPILVYVYRSFGGASSAVMARAQDILVNFRIPHHAIISQWFDATAVVKLLLVTAALVAIRRTRLFVVMFLVAFSTVALTAIQALLENDQLALLFPWRLSTLLVPLSVAVLLAWLVDRLVPASVDRFSGGTRLNNAIFRGQWASALRVGSIALILAAALVGGVRFWLDLGRKDSSAERPLERWVAAHPESDGLYLTPVKMQDFRLATGAPVFIEFKSIPYQEADVLEWYRRIQAADDFYKRPTCDRLAGLSAREGITHAVLEEDSTRLDCPFIRELYLDSSYRLVEINSP